MPDYDLKNIPVLDDIIELEKNDPAEQTAIDALAPDEVDSNFDLFTDDSTEEKTASLIDTAGAEISIFNEGVINDHVATVDDKQITANQHPASLENIVNDVVKQLLPDLEQQLRFLVQQALEDKLPENIITQLLDKSEH